MAYHQKIIFDVIDDLLMDNTIKFSMLSGEGPVLARVKIELTKYLVREANTGTSIEEFARSFDNT